MIILCYYHKMTWLFLFLLTLTNAQRPTPPGGESKPDQPDPPPGATSTETDRPIAGMRSRSASFISSGTSSWPSPSTKYIFAEDCVGEMGEFGKWIEVNQDDCPIAFDDPNFSGLSYLCG